MDEKKLLEKRMKIEELYSAVDFPPMLEKFFDWESDELLDKKIAVLTRMKEGTPISDIPNFYDILELYPKNEAHWD